MKGVLFFSLILILFSFCKVPPPKVHIRVEPAVSEVEAGSEIFLIGVCGLTKFIPKYKWRVEGECKAELKDPRNIRTALKIPRDCKEGMVTIFLEVTTKRGVSKAEVTLKVLPLKQTLKPFVVRYAEPPLTWKMLNDYEKFEEPLKNLWEGAFGVWGFEGGKCEIISPSKDETGELKIKYYLPISRSACGHFEYFKGELGKSEPVDLSSFEKFTFILKSADGKQHRIRFELVEFDPWEKVIHQGVVGESKIFVAENEEKRYEIDLNELKHPQMNIKSGKQIGLKIDKKDGNGTEGVIIIDNLAFIQKEVKE